MSKWISSGSSLYSESLDIWKFRVFFYQLVEDKLYQLVVSREIERGGIIDVRR